MQFLQINITRRKQLNFIQQQTTEGMMMSQDNQQMDNWNIDINGNNGEDPDVTKDTVGS